MRDRITTTKNGFRVEDITFRHARKQSQILDELPQEQIESGNTAQVPVSMTPEQVISYFESIVDTTRDAHEKKLYTTVIKWIEELFELRKKLLSVEQKLEVYQKAEAESKARVASIEEE